MRTKQIVGPTIVLALPLVALAITHVLPNCLKTFQPTYVKEFVFQTAVLLAAWSTLALARPTVLPGLRAFVSKPSARLVLVLLLLLSCLSPCWSRTPSASAKAAAAIAFCLVWAWVVATYVSTSDSFARVARALLVAAVLAAAWGLAEFLWPAASEPRLLRDDGYRLMRPLGNPNFMAGLLNVGILVALAQFASLRTRAPARWGAAACVPLMGAALFWTRSLAGFVALPFGLVALAFLRGPRWLRATVCVGGMISVLALAGVVAWPRSPALERFMATAMRPESTAHVRPLLWIAAVDMVKERPLFGRAMGGFITDHPTYRLPAAGLYRWASDKHFAIHTHNEWLQVAVELGLVGLALYVLLLTSAAASAWRWLQAQPHSTEAWAVSAALAGLIALQVQGMFGVGLRYWDLAPFHWTIVGMLIGTTRPLAARHREPGPVALPWRKWLAAGVCLALWLALPVRGYLAQALTLRALRAKDSEAATCLYLRAMRHSCHHVDEVRLPFMLASAASRWASDEGAELAIQLYRQVDRLAPNFARCRLYTGVLHLRQGRDAQAVAWLSDYLRHNPYSAQARLALARAHENLGKRAAGRHDWPASAQDFRTAFSHNPKSPEAAAGLALAEAECGHRIEARRWLRWLTTKRPQAPALREAIQRAQRLVEDRE